MRKAIAILCVLLLIGGCARSDGEYDRGYADGYAAALAEVSREMPEISPTPVLSPTAVPRQASTPSPLPSDDFTVYISSSFTMHKKSGCSGMKNYIAMPYSVAKDYVTKKCGTCFK